MPGKTPSAPKAGVDVPADEPKVELGLLSEVLGFRLRRIQNHLSRSLIERLRRPDVRSGAFSALALIDANPGISQKSLAREIGLDQATVVSIVDALETQGWAQRRRAETDRRRHALSITPVGARVLAEFRTVYLANEAGIYAALSEAERTDLFCLLDKIYGVCFSKD